MTLNKFAKEIWTENYKAPEDKKDTDTYRRLSSSCASVENPDKRKQIEDEFFNIISDHKFVPGGRIMANIGVKGRESTTLMNCFVHHPKDINYQDPDSLKGIHDMLGSQEQTLKSEGGKHNKVATTNSNISKNNL